MLKGRARLRDALMLQCFLSLFAVKMRNVLMVVRCVAGPDQWRAASLSQWYKLSADCVAHPPHKCQTPDASALLRHDPETLPSGNPVPTHKARDPARPEAGQRGCADFDERGSRARSRHGGGTGYQARNEVRWFQGRVWRLQ